MEITGKVKLLKNKNVDSSGVAIAPLAHELDYGQIAVNYNAINPALFFKVYNETSKTDEIVKIVTEEVIADTLVEILGGAAADLSTLKELLDAFGSSDIATTQASILTRLSSLESGKVDKVAGKGLSTNDYTNADKAHMTNTANPHAVTKAQVGLGNVVNKEQLGKNESAVAAGCLDGDATFSDANANPKDRSGLFYVVTSASTPNYPSNGSCLTMARALGSLTTTSLKWQLYASNNTLDDSFYFRKGFGTAEGFKHGNWLKVYNSGNANLSTVDWAARKLTSNGDIVNNGNNYYIKTASDWKGWGRGLYWQNEKGSNIANISAGGATGDTVAGMTFELTGVERMRIANNGYVGMGTASPDVNLHLYQETGNVTAKVANKTGILITSVDSTGFGKVMMQTDNSLVFGINNTEYARFSAGNLGNLGIGMTQPTEKLQVAGNILATNMFIGGSNTKNQVWHAGNSNKADVDWTTRHIFMVGYLHKNTWLNNTQLLNTSGTDTDKSLYLGNPTVDKTVVEVKDYNSAYIKDSTGRIWNAGNSNKSNVEWTAASLISNTIKPLGENDITTLYALPTSDERILRLSNKLYNASIGSKSGSVFIATEGGTKRPFWVVGDNVGIGTPTPSQALDVMGNITLGTTGTGTTEKPDWTKLDFKGYYGIYGRIQSRDRSINNGDGLMQFLVRGNSGAATNVEPQLVLSLTADKSAEFQGNGLFNGNVTAKGDVVAYSATSNVRIEPVAGGATNLFDLSDVELPTDLTNNHVLAYNATKKKWTAVESAGTNGSAVDYARLSNVPTTFAPCPHNHEDATYISDVRLKQNIEPLNNALNTVLSLNAKSFGWTTEAKERYDMKDEMSYGYIAQDVQKIIPEIVKELETGDGYIGVEYIKVIPFITEAIRDLHLNNIETNQELKRSIKELKRSIASYKLANDQLANEITSLKQKISI